jgi:gliding motility-associated-like protein
MNKLITYFLLITGMLVLSVSASATHNRAGEITYEQISELTYKITIITYTATGPGWTADRPELEIFWGDNTSSILPRNEIVDLPGFYRRNRYQGTHTFPGPGIFELVVEDPNRNQGVDNIPNSVNVVFSISTILQISPEDGTNNTPILTQPPVDKAAVGQIFIHNPGAYDPDGDSISYKLDICRGENGEPIEGYTLPPASNSLTLNALNGDLVWDSPTEVGVYNIAIRIEEWRNGHKIGQIIRDMQIEVYESDDNPPVITAADKHCVEADSLLELTIPATDVDGDAIIMSAYGAPFLIPDSYATFDYEDFGNGSAEGSFAWQTTCDYVRRQPYVVNFKAQDNASPVNLVDIKNVNIYVIGPKTEITDIQSTTNSITLTWESNRCQNVVSYDIYRHTESVDWEPGICDTGIPDSLGYQLVGNVEGRNSSTYLDNNNGAGLPQGYNYCYRIVARFQDGAESYASDEICTELIRGIPTITNVSVENTDENTGEIYLAWSKPTEFDTSEFPGPYHYLIYHSTGQWGENLQLIDSTTNINDTIFYHSNINTKDSSHSYLVEMWNNEAGNRVLLGTPHIASSIFLEIVSGDNELSLDATKNVPWQNQEYTFFRQAEDEMSFDSIGTSADQFFLDSLLINGKEYCYKVRSTGSYVSDGFVDPIINWSQINCGTPVDTIPPCPPPFNVVSLCDSLYNEITWTMPDSCRDDVYQYYIHFAPDLSSDLTILDSIPAAFNQFSFKHYPERSMAGCYYVTAVDSFQNESPKPAKLCVDNCSYYELPNIFTPNNDGINDFYHPKMPYYFVSHIEMQIFNRWGQVMFETTDPDIMWDGRYQKNNRMVSPGIYFYSCEVYEYRLTGIEARHLHGVIHVYPDKESSGQPIPNE